MRFAVTLLFFVRVRPIMPLQRSAEKKMVADVEAVSNHRHTSLCAANSDLFLYFGRFRRIELVPYGDHTTALDDCNRIGRFLGPSN